MEFKLKKYLYLLTLLIFVHVPTKLTGQIGKYISQKNISINQGFGSNSASVFINCYYQIKRTASINLNGGINIANVKNVKEQRSFFDVSSNFNVYRFSTKLYFTLGAGLSISKDVIKNESITLQSNQTRIGTHLNGMFEYFFNKSILLKIGVVQKYFFDNEKRYTIYYGIGYCF